MAVSHTPVRAAPHLARRLDTLAIFCLELHLTHDLPRCVVKVDVANAYEMPSTLPQEKIIEMPEIGKHTGV